MTENDSKNSSRPETLNSGGQEQLISQDHLIKGEEDNQDKELRLKTLKEELVVEVLK